MKSRIFAVFFILLFLPAAVMAQGSTVMLNQVSRELNQIRSILDKVADKANPDTRSRVNQLLEARKLLDRIVGRQFKHPETPSVLKDYGTVRQNLIDELDKTAKQNHNQEGLKKCLAAVEMLLKILPGDKRYTEWKNNLTFKDRAQAAARVYTGEETPVDLITGNKNESRRLLMEAAERLSFRHLEPALNLYEKVLEIEPQNVEASTRIKEVEEFIEVDREISRLEEITENIERAAISGIPAADLTVAFASLERLEKIDPTLNIRQQLQAPPPPPTLYNEGGKLDENINKKFQDRRIELEKRHFLHLCRAGVIHIQNNDYEASRQYRDRAETIDRFALEFLVLTLAFDIHEGKMLEAMTQLRRMASERGLASNMIGFYLMAPYYFFQRWVAFQVNPKTVTYWMIFRSHASIYSRVYWPMLLVFGFQAGFLAWSGRRTYGIWDLATNGQLTRIITFSNKSPVYYLDQATAMMDKGKPEKALRYYNKAIDGDAYMASAWLGRGKVHLAMNKFVEARTDLEKTMQLRPNEKQVQYLLALAYDRLNMRQEAIVTLEAAIGLGLQMRDFNMDDVVRNHHQYRKVFQEYRRTAEKLLEPS